MLREPVAEVLVQLRALRFRKAVVGGVAHEEMAEAKRILAGEERPVRPDQLLADERGQLGREPRLLGRERLDDAVVEHLAFDGAALEHGALRPVELVEAGCEQRLQRRRHLDLAVVGGLHHRCHLFHEERVAAGGLQDPLTHVCAELSLADPCLHQRLRLVVAERLQPEHAAPAAAPVEQLRSRHAEQQDRSARRQERHVLEQLEEDVLAPLDVVEDGDERLFGRDRLEQLAERPRDLVRRRRAALAEQRGERVGGNGVELDSRPLRLELLQHLHDGPVGDPLPVGEAASADDCRVGGGQEFGREARLAHPCRSDDRDQLAARPAARPLPRLGERCQLPLAPDQRRVEPSFRDRGRNGNEPPRGHRLTLALQRQRLDGIRLDRDSGQTQRRLAEQGLTGLRGLLQPRGNVDGVTRREPLLGASDHLAATDADPALDAELGQGQLHLRRRPERAHGIVFVHGRQPEDRHHGVADELLDDATVALDDRLHPLEIAREQGTERLRVERLAERRRTGDVTEQHGHDLAPLARRPVRSRAALGTEPERAGGLVPARGAGGHARQSRNAPSGQQAGRARRGDHRQAGSPDQAKSERRRPPADPFLFV